MLNIFFNQDPEEDEPFWIEEPDEDEWTFGDDEVFNPEDPYWDDDTPPSW